MGSTTITASPHPTDMPAGTSADAANVQPDMRQGLLLMLLLVLAVRVVVFAAGALSALTATPEDFNPRYADGRPWVAFDVIHYAKIAREGYPTEGIPPLIAFFPLLPMTARVLLPVMSAESALLLLSNLATVGGFAFLYLWCRQWANHATSLAVCLLLATFPASAFFSAGMTEGPFFCTCAAALYCLGLRRLWTAALICGLATALRPTGVALAVVVLLWAAFELFSRRQDAEHDDRPSAGPAIARWLAIGVLSFGGIAAFQVYLWTTYGQFDAYFQAQSYWEPGGLKTQEDLIVMQEIAAAKAAEVRDLSYYVRKAITPQAWNRGLVLLIVGVTVCGLVRPTGVPRVLLLLPLIIFLMSYLPGWGERLSSIARFETGAVPVFAVATLLLLRLGGQRVLVSVVVLQLLAQIYYAYLFTRGVWVG